MRFSTIDHLVRKKFEISVNDYLVADAIQFMSRSPYNDTTWVDAPIPKILEYIGVSDKTIKRSVAKLTSIGLIEKKGSRSFRTTKKWFDAIKIDQDQKNEKKDEKSSFPTIEQVKAYADECGRSSDADTFFNYYNAIGWSIKGSEVKNWKSLFGNWNIKSQNAAQKNSNGAAEAAEPTKQYSDEAMQFIGKCRYFNDDVYEQEWSVKSEIYQSGEYIKNGKQFFTEIEYEYIRVYGGLQKVVMYAYDYEFVDDMVKAINLVNGGAL